MAESPAVWELRTRGTCSVFTVRDRPQCPSNGSRSSLLSQQGNALGGRGPELGEQAALPGGRSLGRNRLDCGSVLLAVPVTRS